MIIKPKVKDFICTTAHPDGCAESIRRQIEYVTENGRINNPKRVLVIGCSTGYGLASRIALAFGNSASTLGVMFEREATEKRTATPGYYNTVAFEQEAHKNGLYARSINGDAFSTEIKEQVIAEIKENLGSIDMLVYSLAAPRRTTSDGTTYHSVLKTIGEPFTEKTWILGSDTIETATIPTATEEEITATVKVMGGEDWADWIQALSGAGVLASSFTTVAYSYIGPELTYPVYNHGTIGMAKKHLKETCDQFNDTYGADGLKAYVSVNKALVTQSSSAIPIVPLYFSILYRVMKDMDLHEGCIEQMQRLFQKKIFSGKLVPLDSEGYIRMDDWEMKPEVQEQVMEIWKQINTENLKELADTDGYWEDFYHMFGFHYSNVDYEKDVQP